MIEGLARQYPQIDIAQTMQKLHGGEEFGTDPIPDFSHPYEAPIAGGC